jgi:hypothetical protein
LSTTWCERASPDATLNCTAKNAGTVIAGGVSLPPEPITNVAGTRTLVEPRLERGVVEMLVLLADEELLGLPEDDVALFAVAVVALAADELVVVAEAEAAGDEDEWLELPQAPSSAVIGSTKRSLTPRLTVFRIDVDYLLRDEAWLCRPRLDIIGDASLSTTPCAVGSGSSVSAAITGRPAAWSQP